MASGSRRLIKAGFVSGKFKAEHPHWKALPEDERKKILDEMEKNGTINLYADHDEAELQKNQITKLDYPRPLKRYTIVYETPHQSVEPIYYLGLHLMEDMSFSWIEKITDLFAASEHSSFYGAAAQRLGLAQDRVSQYLAQIGQFIRKDLFQLVRDIRWIDERIKFHKDAREGLESAEITLKGIWTDLVDGVVQGQRVSANIFTMAQQLQFTALPDWFFSLSPKKVEEIDALVEKVPTTQVVKSVLKRKLHDYMTWREYNFKELQQRRTFEINYLNQHYNIVRMYVQWVKPYLRHIERLRADTTKLSRPELVSSFESSMVDIEILGMSVPKGNEKVYSCLLLSFEYRTRPSMQFQQDSYQHKGPLHMGETRITWRAYSWTREQIEAFKQMKEAEDLEMLKTIDSSIAAAMDAIGDDLQRYLKEAREDKPKEKEESKNKRPGMFEPFVEIFKGFGEFVSWSSGGVSVRAVKKKKARESARIKSEQGPAKGFAKAITYAHYKVFKKSNRLLAW